MLKKLLFLILFIMEMHCVFAQSQPLVEYKRIIFQGVCSYRVDGKLVSNRAAGKVMKSNIDAYSQYIKAKKLGTVSNVIFGTLLIGSLTYNFGIDTDDEFNRRDKIVLFSQCTGLISVIAMDIKTNKMHRKAASIYNGKRDTLSDTKKEKPILRIGMANVGVGINLIF